MPPMITNAQIFVLILAMSITSASFADKYTLDRFESDPASRWSFISDQVMGGISTGKVEFRQYPNEVHAHMEGNVSTQNNGGFIQFRIKNIETLSKDTTGVFLSAKGNNERYFVHLRTKWTMMPWHYYQAEFDVTDVWEEFHLPFASFSPSSSMLPKAPTSKSITAIGVVAFGRDHKVNIRVREIGFY